MIWCGAPYIGPHTRCIMGYAQIVYCKQSQSSYPREMKDAAAWQGAKTDLGSAILWFSVPYTPAVINMAEENDKEKSKQVSWNLISDSSLA